MTNLLFDPPVPQLALLAVSSSLSPGPNNLLIAASGAWFGTRRSLPTLAGMYAGAGLILVAIGFGASAVFEALPALLRVLQFAGAGFLIYLAFGLLKATWSVAPAVAPIGFGRAAALQFVNPKLWLMSMATISLCTRPGPEGSTVSVPLIVFFVVMTVPSMLAYLKFGSVLKSLAASGRARTLVNRVLAALTAISAMLLLTPTHAANTDPADLRRVVSAAEQRPAAAGGSVPRGHADRDVIARDPDLPPCS